MMGLITSTEVGGEAVSHVVIHCIMSRANARELPRLGCSHS